MWEMKKLYASLAAGVICLGAATGAYAQQWTYGGSNNDSGRDFEFTADGGAMIAGHTLSSGAGWNDVYVVKTDASGNKIWAKTYGGNGDDMAYSIAKTSDGQYLIAGSSRSTGTHGVEDFYIVKIDESGTKTMEKWYGTTGIDIAREAVPTPDGGFIVVGYTQSNGFDIMLKKIDAAGNEEWSKTYGGGQYEEGYSVKPVSDGYVVCGTTNSYGNGAGDVWVFKVGLTGIVESSFNKFIGGMLDEEGQYIEVTSDGGFAVVYDLSSNSMGGQDDFDIGIMKLSATGAEEWSKTYATTEKDVVKMIKKTADGGYIVSGITRGFGLINPNFWLIRLNSDGSEQWAKTFGGQNHEHCYATKEMSGGGFISVGHTQSFGAGMDDVYMLKVSSGGLLTAKEETVIAGLKVYPNPANDKVYITTEEMMKSCRIDITNVSGQKIYSGEFSNMTQKSIELNTLSKGIYFLHVSSDRGEQTTKLLID
jgi:hypothetical protein